MIKIKGYEKIDKKEIKTNWNEYMIQLEQPNPYQNDREGFIIYSFTLRGITTPEHIKGLMILKDNGMLKNCEISLTNRSRTSQITIEWEHIRNMDNFLNILTTTAVRLEQHTKYTSTHPLTTNIT
jgi:hypothetical protein